MKKNIISKLILFAAIILTCLFFYPVHAGSLLSLSDDPSSQLIASGADHELTFQIASSIAPDQTLEIFFENGFDLSQITYNDLDFQANSSDLNLGSVPGSGVGSNLGVVINDQTIIFTQNDSDTISPGTNIKIIIGLNAQYQTVGTKQIFNPESAGSYKISLSGTFGDLGTISVPILSSDSIFLKAEIVPSLSFELRNSADNGSANGCLLGTITSFGVSECSYRLAASSNAGHGFRIYIASDGSFRSPENAITDISSNGQVSQGTEGYGISLQPAQDLAKGSAFNNNGDNPIPTQGALLLESDLVYNYQEGNLSTSSLVIHRVAVSFETKPGLYNQKVTYTIIANF